MNEVRNIEDAKKASDNTLPQLEEFDFEYAREFCPTEEILRNILEDFYYSITPLKKKLQGVFEEIENQHMQQAYRIEVHALKSTSAAVGALLLSKLARLLEVAAIKGNTDRIRALHPILMEELEEHKQRIATVLPQEDDKEITKISMDLLHMLRMSLKSEDYDTADLVCTELKKSRYAEKTQKLMDQLAAHILNLETKEAIEIIDKMRS